MTQNCLRSPKSELVIKIRCLVNNALIEVNRNRFLLKLCYRWLQLVMWSECILWQGNRFVSKESNRWCLLHEVKNGPTTPLFRLLSVFSNKQYNIYNKSMWKMSIQYTALRFKPTTNQTWVVTHNHWTRAPAWSKHKYVNLFIPIGNLFIFVPSFDLFDPSFWQTFALTGNLNHGISVDNVFEAFAY